MQQSRFQGMHLAAIGWSAMDWCALCCILKQDPFCPTCLHHHHHQQCRVAELGSLSSGAKMAMKTFVKRVFTIFATNASFLSIIANLQIQLSKICNIYHVIVHFLPKKHYFYLKRYFLCTKFSKKKVRKSRQILIRNNIAYVQA